MENCGFKIDIENIDNDSFKFRIKVEKECWIPKNSTREEWKNCMDKNELTVDYVSVWFPLHDANIYKWKQNFNIKLYLFQTCRFSLFGYNCFCCGAFFHYLEHVRNIMQIFSPHMWEIFLSWEISCNLSTIRNMWEYHTNSPSILYMQKM